MGIKLDWQIEAENVFDRAGEDPEYRRRRRMRRIQVLLFIVGVATCVCVVAGAIWLRLYTVDNQIRQSLIDTAQAETAMIRIGDFAGFIGLQRSASSDWLAIQSDRFKRYQDLKTKYDLNLTGKVLDVAIDGLRGRVLLEEIIDGVPYHTLWFYWQYGKDGWRHVPSDFTFWGDSQTITGKTSVVNYRGLDATLATALETRVEQWWTDGCKTFMETGCEAPALPTLTLRIVPDPSAQIKWDENKPDTLIIPSPLTSNDRARADADVPQPLEEAVATKLADRLFDMASGTLKPTPSADAYWLRQNIVEWMAGAFVGRGDLTRLGFIQSLKDKYGAKALITLIHSLARDSDISVLSQVTQQPLESLALDWRAFFQWRLDLEKSLLKNNNQTAFIALWDTKNPQAVPKMQARLSHPTQAIPQVQSVAISPGPDNVPQATIQATADGNAQILVFRMVNGTWKRAA